MEARVRETLAARALQSSRITDSTRSCRCAKLPEILPWFKAPAERKVTHSAKCARLLEVLEALIAEGRKVLVFSQFVEMLKLIGPTPRRAAGTIRC